MAEGLISKHFLNRMVLQSPGVLPAWLIARISDSGGEIVSICPWHSYKNINSCQGAPRVIWGGPLGGRMEIYLGSISRCSFWVW
jgi:hypothetical protein